MVLFNLSSAQKMLLFSELNNPHNDSFYLKFRKNYDFDDFKHVKKAIEVISLQYLICKSKMMKLGLNSTAITVKIN